MSSKKKVKATFDYTATEAGELTIKKGNIITVLEEDATGWWKGELNGVVGFFPSNFSEPYEDQASSAWPPNQRRISMAPKPKKDNVESKSDEYVKAKHNYKGSPQDGELSCQKGDVLLVLNKDESGWWKGELNGQVGFFPHNFVVAVDKAPRQAASGPSSAQQKAKKQGVQVFPKGAVGLKKRGPKKKGGGAKGGARSPRPNAGGNNNMNMNNGANNAALKEAQRKVKELEGKLRDAKSRGDQLQAEMQSQQQRVSEETQALRQQAAAAEARAQEAEHDKIVAENRAKAFEGHGLDGLDVNELRALKKQLKTTLAQCKERMDMLKLCSSCEVSVKDCILVPCLHAFCQKCGEINKKKAKCSICGITPEKIYVLSSKKK